MIFGFEGGASGGKTDTDPGTIYWGQILRAMGLDEGANRINRYGPFGGWEYTPTEYEYERDEKGELVTDKWGNYKPIGVKKQGGQQFVATSPGMQAAMDRMDRRLAGEGFRAYESPAQMGSITDALMANKMHRMGILDPNDPNPVFDLKQELYGTRFGHNKGGYQSGQGPDSLQPWPEDWQRGDYTPPWYEGPNANPDPNAPPAGGGGTAPPAGGGGGTAPPAGGGGTAPPAGGGGTVPPDNNYGGRPTDPTGKQPIHRLHSAQTAANPYTVAPPSSSPYQGWNPQGWRKGNWEKYTTGGLEGLGNQQLINQYQGQSDAEIRDSLARKYYQSHGKLPEGYTAPEGAAPFYQNRGHGFNADGTPKFTVQDIMAAGFDPTQSLTDEQRQQLMQFHNVTAGGV